MRFALTDGVSVLKYPYNLRAEHPLVSFPAIINPSDLPPGVVVVEDSQIPPNTATTVVTGEGVPVKVGNAWFRSWTTRAATPEEQAAFERGAQDEIDRAALAADPHIVALRDATPQQVRDYIDSHLANLGTAQGQENLRQDMKTLAVAIGFIARQVFK